MMRRSRYIFFGVCLGLMVLGLGRPMFGQESGTLMFDLKAYTSEAKIPKESQKQLEHAGIHWAVLDKTVLIPLLNEKYVKAEFPYLTRFGEQKTLELKAGQYTITCIGYEIESISRDIDKVLAKNAFLNIDVVTFTVLPGKTTTLEIFPTYLEESKSRFLAKLTMFLPELKVRVLEDGMPKGEDLVISRRTDKSVAWNDYHGPLKF
jgi:hypothetical protein